MLVHRGQNRQRGSGLGGFFKGLIRASKPLFRRVINVGKKVVKAPIVQDTIQSAKSEIINMGTATLSDALRGENIKESIIRNAGIAKENIKEGLIDRVSDAIRGNKRKGNKSEQSSKKKKKIIDIFDSDEE